MIDAQAILYNPIYDVLGTDATLTMASGTTASVRVIDKTTGVAVGNDIMAETIKPACRVRAAELASNNIARDDLQGSQITFNGNDWSVDASSPKPGPQGEADGEYELLLSAA